MNQKLFTRNTARHFKAAFIGCFCESFCRRYGCSRLSLSGSNGIGTFRQSLWCGRKRHGNCLRLRQHSSGTVRQKAAKPPSYPRTGILRYLPHSLRNRIYAAITYIYPIPDFIAHVLCLSAWMQSVFHLRDFTYSGTNA